MLDQQGPHKFVGQPCFKASILFEISGYQDVNVHTYVSSEEKVRVQIVDVETIMFKYFSVVFIQANSLLKTA